MFGAKLLYFAMKFARKLKTKRIFQNDVDLKNILKQKQQASLF